MTVEVAVTFEFETRPALTYRGTVSGAKVTTCVSRAVQVARTNLRPQGWRSVVVVVSGRVDAPNADHEATVDADAVHG